MLAVDTNVIVRYLANDHPQQSRRARDLLDGADVFVCDTVLLETEWVLRSVYHYPALQIIAALRAFAGLPRVCLEDATRLARALDWSEQGMDFADALHLASARDCEAFVTFDAEFARSAPKIAGAKMREP